MFISKTTVTKVDTSRSIRFSLEKRNIYKIEINGNVAQRAINAAFA